MSDRWHVPVHSACRYAVYTNSNGGYSVLAVHSLVLTVEGDSMVLGSLVDHSGHYGKAEYWASTGLYSFAPTHERAMQLAKEATNADSSGMG